MFNRPRERFQITPTTHQVSVGVGLPLSGSVAFIPTHSSEEQLRSNLILFVLTQKGERIMNPNYGTNAKRYLFEPIEDVQLLQEELSEEIITRFSSIGDIDVTLSTTPDFHLAEILIRYKVKQSGREDSIFIDLT